MWDNHYFDRLKKNGFLFSNLKASTNADSTE